MGCVQRQLWFLQICTKFALKVFVWVVLGVEVKEPQDSVWSGTLRFTRTRFHLWRRTPMLRTACAVSAVLSVWLVACTSSEDQAARELEEINQALEEVEEQNEEPEPAYVDLDTETENTIGFNGLEYTFSDFDRGVSAWGQDDTPFLGFDIADSNTTGDTVDPGSGVNLWYAY